MEKVLHLVNQLQIEDDYMLNEITDIELLSDSISKFASVYKKNCDEFQSKSNKVEHLRTTEMLLYTKITEKEMNLAEAVITLEDLQSELHNLSKYEFFCGTEGDFFENTEMKMKLYGVQIESQYIEPTICQVKVTFASGKFAVINVDILQRSYDLQATEPRIDNYEEIRTLLLQSGDIAGFLCNLFKFFRSRI